jgi:hypothetical protein
MSEPSVKELMKYKDEWILVVRGKIVQHSKDVMDILKASEDYRGNCYIEKVVEGQVCFY